MHAQAGLQSARELLQPADRRSGKGGRIHLIDSTGGFGREEKVIAFDGSRASGLLGIYL